MNLNCTLCGGLKVGSYRNGSRCGKCIEAKRKERRLQKRRDLDLPEWGTGRDPKCKKCRTIKEEPYINGSLCKKCKLEKAKIDYHKKARSKGTPKKKVGRNPLCSKCDAIKENRHDQYCNACRARMKRERYAAMKTDPEFMKLQREKYHQAFQDNAIARLKKNCRAATNRFINEGLLVRDKCEMCGEMDVEAHHDDYTDPFNVRWLCKKHHAEHHATTLN